MNVVAQYVHLLPLFQWTRSPDIGAQGGRLSISIGRHSSFKLYGYRILSGIEHSRGREVSVEKEILAEGPISCAIRTGKVTVLTTISQRSNLSAVRVKLKTEILNKVGQVEHVSDLEKTNAKLVAQLPGRNKTRACYLKLCKAIAEIKRANLESGSRLIPPWAPRHSLSEPLRPYPQEHSVEEYLWKPRLTPKRGAILQVAAYPDGRLVTEGWVLDLTPWRVKMADIKDNYRQVHNSHKDGIVAGKECKFKEYAILPDRRSPEKTAAEIAEDFLTTFQLDDAGTEE
jgi:hypothetical protein